jgi:hypothetical protein
MTNEKKWLGILVMLLVFAVAITACSKQVDKSINGFWITDNFELSLNNGKFEELLGGTSWRKGTYTTNNGEITVVPTHLYGTVFNTLLGMSENKSGIKAKWYAIKGFSKTFKSVMLNLGLSEEEAEIETTAFINSLNSANRTSTYSLNGDTLNVMQNGVTQSLTRKP